MKEYECIIEFENKDRMYFITDLITEAELNTLTQDEALNFQAVDPFQELFPLQYYD